MMEGIRVDREHLAVDVIRRVGPGGHFLEDDHTFRHFRDNWQPELTDRKSYESWQSEGAQTMGQRAREKVKQILQLHNSAPLPATVDAQIDRILELAPSG